MKLQYATSVPPDTAPLVLVNREGRRIEIHLRHDEAGLFTLLAFSGNGNWPERSTSQGPYYRIDQAAGARRAIASALMAQGYAVDEDGYPIWSLAAQRDINALCESHRQNPVDTRFDPKDVFLDW